MLNNIKMNNVRIFNHVSQVSFTLLCSQYLSIYVK